MREICSEAKLARRRGRGQFATIGHKRWCFCILTVFVQGIRKRRVAQPPEREDKGSSHYKVPLPFALLCHTSASLTLAGRHVQGVSWHRASQQWQARIQVGGKKTHLGYFGGEEAAARKYDEQAAGEATAPTITEASDWSMLCTCACNPCTCSLRPASSVCR